MRRNVFNPKCFVISFHHIRKELCVPKFLTVLEFQNGLTSHATHSKCLVVNESESVGEKTTNHFFFQMVFIFTTPKHRNEGSFLLLCCSHHHCVIRRFASHHFMTHATNTLFAHVHISQ